MAQQDHATSPPISPPINVQISSAKSTARHNSSSSSPLRQRPLGRAATVADVSNPLRHRRSSTFSVSDSVDDARQSIRSSTEDLLLPRARSPDVHADHEHSHWHSIPLALALLPALGGLFFEGGSAVVTDLTLLGLAAVFLNWSVRLPWNWYLSAQSIKTEEVQAPNDGYISDTIIEEGSEEEDQESQLASPSPSTKDANSKTEDSKPNTTELNPSQTSAATELRIYELLALTTCFMSPVIGAWLLHHIRSQLSRPSEGLVSNYNLTIFLLASELRPLSHLIKLVQARTLHLQRTVNPSPFSPPSNGISSSTLQDLSTRITELETHIADTSSTKQTPVDLTLQARKAFQPDLDALNRAVRRYEKRTTLLSLQTESRLQDLEKRMGDAITLAAAAERSSQSTRQRRGSSVALLLDWATTMALLPLQVLWTVFSLPGRVIAGLVRRVEGYIGQKVRREIKTAGRTEARGGSGSEKRRIQGRGQKKAM